MRADGGVLDASVAVKCLVVEEGSDAARTAVAARRSWIAPDLILIEIASVAVKFVRRSLVDRDQGAAMVANIGLLLDETVPLAALKDRAFALAINHGFSAYDAAYLALAEAEDLAVLTADLKFAAKARDAGLGDLVETLAAA
jgi:predicted nucleic acid-binding protein